jgi:hypothetical protein
MKQFRQRHRAVWGSSHAQDIAEYAVMLAVIVLLVIGTLKLISGKKGKGHHPAPTPTTTTNPK